MSALRLRFSVGVSPRAYPAYPSTRGRMILQQGQPQGVAPKVEIPMDGKSGNGIEKVINLVPVILSKTKNLVKVNA